MRWKGRRQSENVEDRRGRGAVAGVGGGIGILVVALIVMLMGGDPSALLGGNEGPAPGSSREFTPAEQEAKDRVSVILADTEEVWGKLFAERGLTYREPKLVLFSGQVQSACGFASAAVGPFYCGPDSNVYIDLSFFDDLASRFGAPGEFAQAYVLAHEVGHHVHNLLGEMDRVNTMRQRLSESEANAVSVRLELQADFYAGVWAHHARQMAGITRQDIVEAVRAAEAVGDDRIQMQTQGQVTPDAFTHGTSEQRVRWFMKGFESGRIEDGDTFGARRL